MLLSKRVRRAALLGFALLVVLGALLPVVVGAQGYPDKPVRLIVPFGAGSFPDVVARTVGQKMAEGLGQPVVIDNRVGAGGNIGSEAVVKAAPDGHTILLHTVANAINKSLYRNLSFDPVRDLAPVGQIAVAANVLAVPPSLGVTTFGDFLARARTRRPELAFASGGNGTTSHLAAQLLKSMAKFGAEHVPYKNFSQALTDVIAGQPQFVIPNLPPTMPHIQSGRLRALAVTGARRSALLPEVPTVAESGLAGYEVSSWNGLAVPVGTPAEIVRRLHAELVRALRDPAVARSLGAQGAEIIGSGPGEYGALIEAEAAKWARVISDAGAQVD